MYISRLTEWMKQMNKYIEKKNIAIISSVKYQIYIMLLHALVRYTLHTKNGLLHQKSILKTYFYFFLISWKNQNVASSKTNMNEMHTFRLHKQLSISFNRPFARLGRLLHRPPTYASWMYLNTASLSGNSAQQSLATFFWRRSPRTCVVSMTKFT